MRYEIIAWDGFASWRSEPTITRLAARNTKAVHEMQLRDIVPAACHMQQAITARHWPSIKIYDRKLKKFIH